jgi:hypothetical protein
MEALVWWFEEVKTYVDDWMAMHYGNEQYLE